MTPAFPSAASMSLPSDPYRVEARDAQWRFVSPGGQDFLSVGLNHLEESSLKYPHNRHVWRERYGSRERWILDGVVRDLGQWGFNTIGWTREYVSGRSRAGGSAGPVDQRHSEQWVAEDFRIAGMPYVVQLRIAEFEGWNGHPVFPDLDSQSFADYCAHLARSVCAAHADSPDLLGYFLLDVPAWAGHPTGAWFSRGGGASLYDQASRYYETIAREIRRQDPHHLILGDRYDANLEIPDAVLRAMAPFVDVLSVQYFPAPNTDGHARMRRDLRDLHARSGKPILIADIGNRAPTRSNPEGVGGLPDQAARGADYVAALAPVVAEPWLLGWHWCGYLETTSGRPWGLKDPWDDPYLDLTEEIAAFNRQALLASRPRPARP